MQATCARTCRYSTFIWMPRRSSGSKRSRRRPRPSSERTLVNQISDDFPRADHHRSPLLVGEGEMLGQAEQVIDGGYQVDGRGRIDGGIGRMAVRRAIDLPAANAAAS